MNGACSECHGLGTVSEFDPEMVVPDEGTSLENGAIEAWRKNGKRMNIYYARSLREFCRDFGIKYEQPYKDIPKKVQQILMYGTDKKGDLGSGTWWEGVIPNLERRFENTESEFVKTRLHGYMSEMPCKACCGTRLKKEALAVRLETATPGPVAAELDCLEESRAAIGGSKKKNNGQEEKSAPPFLPKLPGYSIHDVTGMTVLRARQFFENLKLGAEGTLVAEPIA